MQDWPNINAVRMPLNESCWLGINGVAASYSGESYKTAIQSYVKLLHGHDLIPILELHWVGPGTTLATRLQPMPDADHAPAFWADVATTFLDDDAVVFEAFNEPYPDRNRDSDAAVAVLARRMCGQRRCRRRRGRDLPGGRDAGADRRDPRHRLAARDLARRPAVLERAVAVAGPQADQALDNLGAAWHVYNFNALRLGGVLGRGACRRRRDGARWS